MIYSIHREPYLKRVPTVIDLSYGFQAYDLDNLYPQRADEVRNRSYTTKSAVSRLAEFIDGEGFLDPALANLVVNSEGQTWNDVLDIVAQDKAPFNAFALHFKYNLNFRICEITPIDAMFCRFGIPDTNGNVSDIKYSNNWERDYYKTVDKSFVIESFPVFNPDPAVVQAQMEEYGWEDYPGQILYWTPKPGMYPKAPFDPVFDNAQSQSEIGVFELSSIQNGFTASKIFKYPGTFENDAKRQEFKRKLNEHKGARGANSTIVVENPSGEDLDLVEDLQITNTDKMFEFTSKNVKNAIRESMAMPAPLLGQLPENGMFNKEQMEDSYTYVNAMTRGHRNQISREVKKIMAYWKDVLTIQSFEIIEQAYIKTAAPALPVPGQPAPEVKPEFNDKLAGLTGKQSQNLRRIQRQFDKGTLTKAQALAELKLSFGLSEADALTLLDDDTSNDAV